MKSHLSRIPTLISAALAAPHHGIFRVKIYKRKNFENLCCNLVEKWRERRKTWTFGDLFWSNCAGLSFPWKCAVYYLCPSCCLSGILRRSLDVLHLGSRWIFLGRILIGLRCSWDAAQSPRSSWSHAPRLNFHRRWKQERDWRMRNCKRDKKRRRVKKNPQRHFQNEHLLAGSVGDKIIITTTAA